ncbi:iron complex outermembrane recepter protein [Candidatus Symbiobacter mobilis CR]|uniref:Iron complex outermembrane recepter protein n=1 Tax=Candidatus Symbiobacter mobilis CR TaxID=946483 RepID=U5NAX0_9BURK|nr:iron complex outermembrane recepter protein [Candidatus Symbiobacter mobilis CR]
MGAGDVVWAVDRAVQDSKVYYDRPLEELLRIETQAKAEVGSRGGSRDALDAEVPIDVITAAQLQSTGQSSLQRALTMLVVGFNAPRPSIADGTDHAPPFTLRGLNPDQVLVLVNGKRLHQSSLLHNNGTVGRGSSGVDLDTIPLYAVERVEVLRDGAAAQYGSEAIAGILNIVLKGYGYGSHATVGAGRTTKGDGTQRHADVFLSQPLAGDGFLNLTAALHDRGPTNRAGPDPADGGRINTHFGDADTQDALLAIHGELPHGDVTPYFHVLHDTRRSSAGAFYRTANSDRNIPAIYPDGFLPLIEPKITDTTATGGVRGLWADGTRWDWSLTHGQNDYHFYVNHSLNRSMGASSPTSFDSGATRYTQQTLNGDISKRVGRHYWAGGVELRREHYRITPGEPASYRLGQDLPWYAGSQGFGGFSPENAVSATRDAYSLYGDWKYSLSERLSIDTAARAERYSDFGSTLNGKLALRYRANEDTLLRASASTGFRAPSLSQSHFSSTASYRDGDSLMTFGNYGVDHPVARALGATALKPEESQHLTVGIVLQPSSQLTASADVFWTDIADRILPTGYISAGSLQSLSPQAVEILRQHGVEGAVYFTNAIATRTRGIDLRLEYRQSLENSARLKWVGAYQYSKTAITQVNPAPSVLGVDMMDLILEPFVRVLIEGAQPRDAFKLWTQYSMRDVDVVLNLNRFGKYSSTANYDKVTFAARWTLDAEVAYRLAKDVTLAVGATNLFDAYPQAWGETGAKSVISSGDIVPYSQYAPFGYNGAYYYLRLTVGW